MEDLDLENADGFVVDLTTAENVDDVLYHITHGDIHGFEDEDEEEYNRLRKEVCFGLLSANLWHHSFKSRQHLPNYWKLAAYLY